MKKPASLIDYHLNESEKEQIQKLLEGMTIEEKIGQMVTPFAFGNFLNRSSDEYKRIHRLITHYKVGGICLFKGTILNYAHLINEMQSLTETPLLISADFERGLGMRLTDAIQFPYNMGVGATGNPEYAYKMGLFLSQEMKALGVHQNYAPVADVNTHINNPIVNVRAYSEDKNIVAEYCAEFIRGCNEENILTSAKHFPGHGNTDIDSHVDLSLLYSTEKEFYDVDLYPFEKAVEAGVSSLMIAHVDVPGITGKKNFPATVSPFIVTELIRNRLKFDGLVVTDAMTMYGITSLYSAGEGAVKAILAGSDILLLPPDEEVAIESLYRAAKSGVITEERIDRSVRRILKAKLWADVFTLNKVDISKLSMNVNRPETFALAMEISEKSIKVIEDKEKILPLDFSRKISCITISDIPAGELELTFHNELNNRCSLFRKFVIDSKSSSVDYLKAITIAENSSVVIVPLFIRIRAFQGGIVYIPEQIEFIQKLIKMKIEFVLISFGNPYINRLFDGLGTYVNAYGDSTIVQEAAARIISTSR
ncbi:MAG: glycoside hydrolase family 3 protein [Ignavibacteriaceae bacterium]